MFINNLFSLWCNYTWVIFIIWIQVKVLLLHAQHQAIMKISIRKMHLSGLTILNVRTILQLVNTLRPRQNGHHFADDIFKCIFFNENIWILIKISLRIVPKGRINNIPALVQIMAWRRSGDKPLSEPMIVSLPTHICVTRPQWVNTFETILGNKPTSRIYHTWFEPMVCGNPTTLLAGHIELLAWLISSWTKWLPFHRQHFQMHIQEWIVLYLG